MGLVTAVLAHGHFPGDPQEDSQCTICKVVHSGYHVMASVAVALPFALVRWAFVAVDAQISDSQGQFLVKHGRAPPLF
jgi:hypothetical protein